MTAHGRKRYEYTTDRANRLTGVLTVRIIVGLPLPLPLPLPFVEIFSTECSCHLP